VLSFGGPLPNLSFEQYAVREEIDNEPTPEIIDNIRRVALTLEIIRLELGAPIRISSGYRSPELNRRIGGSKNSKHMEGLAADFTVSGYTPNEAVDKISGLVGYNKLILEFDRWVHLDLSDELLNEVLVASKRQGKTHYEVIS